MTSKYPLKSPLRPGPAKTTTLIDWVSLVDSRVTIGIAATIFLALSAWSLTQESCTYDEGTHLSAGYVYLTRRDYRLSIDNPPLAKVFGAIPLLLLDVHVPKEPAVWNNGTRYAFAYDMLYRSGNNPEQLLFWSRLFNLFWSVVLAISVYAVSRGLFGPRGGMISLSISAFSPAILAHGHMMTTDIPVTTLMFLSVVAFGLLLEKWTLFRSVACGLLTGGALLAKHSGIFLLPLFVWIGGRYLWTNLKTSPRGGQTRVTFIKALGFRIGCLLLLGGVSWAAIWACYGFRFAGSPDSSYAFPWKSLRHPDEQLTKLLLLLRDHRVLPEAHLFGIAQVSENTHGHPAYAVGNHSLTGWWWYFPFAFLVKTPVATVILIAWGFCVSAGRHSKRTVRDQILYSPLLILGLMIVGRNMNIGIRHILPLFPYLLVAAGGIRFGSRNAPGSVWQRRAVAGLLFLAILDPLAAAPHFLAYFNFPCSALFQRDFLLVDSNLDWGQDLGNLKRYLDQNGISNIKLAYFGAASPEALSIKHEVLPAFNVYTNVEIGWKRATKVLPGDYVAVSATCFRGDYLMDHEYYIRHLGHLTPIATIGHSILIFKIPEDGGFRP